MHLVKENSMRLLEFLLASLLIASPTSIAQTHSLQLTWTPFERELHITFETQGEGCLVLREGNVPLTCNQQSGSVVLPNLGPEFLGSAQPGRTIDLYDNGVLIASAVIPHQYSVGLPFVLA